MSQLFRIRVEALNSVNPFGLVPWVSTENIVTIDDSGKAAASDLVWVEVVCGPRKGKGLWIRPRDLMPISPLEALVRSIQVDPRGKQSS